MMNEHCGCEATAGKWCNDHSGPCSAHDINNAALNLGDRVLDTRPDGQRGVITGFVDHHLAIVRMGQASYDITIASRHLLRVE